MSTSRFRTTNNGRCKAPVPHSNEPKVRKRVTAVLAERNQAVVAVGAWVEGGYDFTEHPAALALLTEELQAGKRRETEESLRRFQDEVRHRVATRLGQRRTSPRTDSEAWTQHASGGGDAPHTSSEAMRQVRLRLAACRMIPHGEVMSNLPGGQWNKPPTRHRDESHVLGAEQEGDHLFSSQHECPLVQQKQSGQVWWDSEKSDPDPGLQSDLPQVAWLLKEKEELKRQRQSRVLLQRRHYMNMEREQVKENNEHRKHLKRTARIKAEKEQVRLEEERELENVQRLAEARQKLEERELLILERLRLEEEDEEKAAEMKRKRRVEKGKEDARFIEALKAQLKERLPEEGLDLPPLCCCAPSLWEASPDTCANNCVFHNNPRAFAKALHSTMLSLDLH